MIRAQRLSAKEVRLNARSTLSCPCYHSAVRADNGVYSKNAQYHCDKCDIKLYLMLLSYKKQGLHYAGLVMEN